MAPAEAAWDHYCARVCAVLPGKAGSWVAYYDGSNNVSENYEEKTGIAVGDTPARFARCERSSSEQGRDRRIWREGKKKRKTKLTGSLGSVTPEGPALVSPHRTRSLRYVSVVDRRREEGRLYFFYELCRPDGAHELRRATVKA